MTQSKNVRQHARRQRPGAPQIKPAPAAEDHLATEIRLARSTLKAAISKVFREGGKHQIAEQRFWEKQVTEARRLNKITVISAGVSVFGMAILGATLFEAHQANIEANRAWVSVIGLRTGHIISPTDPIGAILPGVVLSNIGKEPALDIHSYSKQFWVYPKTGTIVRGAGDLDYPVNDTCDGKGDETHIGVMWPQSPIPYSTSSPSPVLPTEEFKDGKALFGYQGCITYRTFGQLHHTAYCFVVLAPSSFLLQPPGNDFSPTINNPGPNAYCAGANSQWAD